MGETITFGFEGEGEKVDNIISNYQLYSYGIYNTEYVELSDGQIERDYLFNAIYPNLVLNDISSDNVKLSDDYDEDGLSLELEYYYDTNPFFSDTDEDGVSDYDEINKYGTNPIKYDTDEDSMGDGTEVTKQNVRVYNVEEYILQDVETLPSVQITGKGDYSQQLYAVNIENNTAILDIDCLVGTPYEFVHNDDMLFETSTLTFSVSDSILENYDLSELAIAYYDEDINTLQVLETMYNFENNSLSTEVEHYSIYMVVSIKDYFYNIDSDNDSNIIESGKADVVFVIDTTGSMDGELVDVKNSIEEYIYELEQNNVDARLGLVEYKDIYSNGSESTKNHGWYTDVSLFEEKLSSLSVSGGGGDGPETVVDALSCARQMTYRTGAKNIL